MTYTQTVLPLHRQGIAYVPHRGILTGQSDRSVIGYPGGKHYARKILHAHIPTDVEILVSPFFGGGSLEIYCASRGIHVYAGDAFEPLVNFWQHLQHFPKKMSEYISLFFPMTPEKFYELKKTYLELDSRFEKACVFYVLNKSSFGGSTFSSGGYGYTSKFRRKTIHNLRYFRAQNIHIKHADFSDTLREHPNTFAYLDPPYMMGLGADLYGKNGDMHKNFEHQRLCDILHRRDSRWMLSYNDIPEIREMYDGYRIEKPQWTYMMGKKGKSNEILIMNY